MTLDALTDAICLGLNKAASRTMKKCERCKGRIEDFFPSAKKSIYSIELVDERRSVIRAHANKAFFRVMACIFFVVAFNYPTPNGLPTGWNQRLCGLLGFLAFSLSWYIP